MIADEDALDHIPKNPPQYDRSHGCADFTVSLLNLYRVVLMTWGGHDIVWTPPSPHPSFCWRGGGVKKKFINKKVFLCNNVEFKLGYFN